MLCQHCVTALRMHVSRCGSLARGRETGLAAIVKFPASSPVFFHLIFKVVLSGNSLLRSLSPCAFHIPPSHKTL